ncbi:PD-(D/E)XK nuclease family protein [Paenibacillus sp. YYML68]|uniref:PD-(D/E)XK nuclease family protein n=1 Tax=Paenibacillus sp. YYML68 TaxID=2909250 RepID=UPI00249247E1|nr:PD-(D/E)XK nuclease family protein [Paenibacillus sp. YYML68]
MSAKLEQVERLLQSVPLQRKILLTGSLSDGHQWLERMARASGAVLNTEVKSLRSWALERCRLALAKRKLTYISPDEGRWLVCRLLQQLIESGSSYVTAESFTPGLADAFYEAIVELREALVTAAQLDARHFCHIEKGQFLQQLLRRYEEELVRGSLVDGAGLLLHASVSGHGSELVIVDQSAVRSAADQQLLERLTDGRYVMLEEDVSFTASNSTFPAGDAMLFGAAGVLAEVREVVRRVLEGGMRWDEVELVCSDRDADMRAVHTTAAAYGISCTYAEGLPIHITAAGQAALLFIDWLESDFRADLLLAGLKQGFLRLHAGDDSGLVTTGRLIRELERSGIGWGRERYKLLRSRSEGARAVGEAQADRGAQVDESVRVEGGTQVDESVRVESGTQVDESARVDGGAQVDESARVYGGVQVDGDARADGGARVDGGVRGDVGAQVDEAVAVRELLADVFDRLLGPLDDVELASPSRLMEALVMFVEACGVMRNEADYEVLSSLKRLARSMQLASGFTLDATLALRHVGDAVQRLRVRAAGTPSPGSLWVTSLSSGGQSGRPYTFIVGMTEAAWSQAARQHPVLLDDERTRISPALPLSLARARRAAAERNSRLGMIQGGCTLSCSTLELAAGKEQLPAYELLQLYRQQRGQADADYEALLEHLGAAVRYYGRANSSVSIALDATEQWLCALQSGSAQLKGGREAVSGRYSWLGSGAAAEQARLAPELSGCDGLLDTTVHPVVLPGDAPRLAPSLSMGAAAKGTPASGHGAAPASPADARASVASPAAAPPEVAPPAAGTLSAAPPAAAALTAATPEIAPPATGTPSAALPAATPPAGAPPATAPPAASTAAYSASKLELYGKCPKRYLYQEVLGVRPKETAVFDRTRWLDAAQRGSLLHDIFSRYLMAVKDQLDDRGFLTSAPGQQDTVQVEAQEGNTVCPADRTAIASNRHLLQDITEQVLAQYAAEVPAPSVHIYRKEADSIRRDVDMFYQSERGRTGVPMFAELPLHEDDAPFDLELSEELTLPLRGYVDRIDRIGPHQYKIYDYKTGSPRSYKHNACFSGGAQLQLPLYGLAVEQWMRRSGFDPKAEVTESSYYFPTERGLGEEVVRPQSRRGELAALLKAMTDSMRSGLFPPAEDPKGCTWCDYSAVCGSHAEQFAAKRSAPDAEARLHTLQEVSRYV